MTDSELVAAFEGWTLPAFPHRDHLRVAFALLRREGSVANAASIFTRVLHHIPKYDENMTRAYLAIVADRMGCQASSEEFLASNPDLVDLRVISRKP
jgi:hypothetical protein